MVTVEVTVAVLFQSFEEASWILTLVPTGIGFKDLALALYLRIDFVEFNGPDSASGVEVRTAGCVGTLERIG